MRDRAVALAALAMIACAPRSAPAPVTRAAASASSVASATQAAPPAPSPFHVIARTAVPVGHTSLLGQTAAPLPLVERTTDGGIVLCSEYARAVAGTTGPLQLGPLLGAGFESRETVWTSDLGDALRWISPGTPEGALVIHESQAVGAGPRLDVHRFRGGAWVRERKLVGYRSPVTRGKASAQLTLALELPVRVLGPGGGGAADVITSGDPARIVRLAGSGPVPRLPPKMCAEDMSLAADGTLLVAGYRCQPDEGYEAARFSFASYGPGATTSTAEEREAPSGSVHPVPLAVSKSELYVAAGDSLHTFDGTRWTASALPGAAGKVAVLALAHAPSGALYMGLTDAGRGRLVRRDPGGGAWTEIPLPPAPAGPLDDGSFSSSVRNGLGVAEPPKNRGAALPATPVWIDARIEEEILVLARVGDTEEKEPEYPPGVTAASKWIPIRNPGDGDEMVLLSTQPREPVLRVPSPLAQLVTLGRTMKRTPVASPSVCGQERSAFLAFAVEPPLEPLKKALKTISTADDTLDLLGTTLEGRERLVVFGYRAALAAALPRLASFKPQVLCGRPLIERPIPLEP